MGIFSEQLVDNPYHKIRGQTTRRERKGQAEDSMIMNSGDSPITAHSEILQL